MSSDPKRGKEHIGLVVLGHVDAGKSTTSGRLLYEMGMWGEQELEELKSQSEELGRNGAEFLLYMNKSRVERRIGVSIECHQRELFTNSWHYTIIDAPGHRNFIKNTINGISQADVALLIVPASKGFFETSSARGNHARGEYEGQTQHHTKICHSLGIKQLIVAIAKMDERSVSFSQERFEEIKSEVEKILKTIGYNIERIPFIPISGLRGDNLTKVSVNMPWWKGFSIQLEKESVSGMTLMDALEKTVRAPKRNINKSFRMPVFKVYDLRGVGIVVTGRVEQGTITVGASVRFYPKNVVGKVCSIEIHNKRVDKAEAGDHIGVNVTGLDRNTMPYTGNVMYIDDMVLGSSVFRQLNTFTALISVHAHPGELRAAIIDKDGNYKRGFTPIVHIHAAKVPCQLLEIKWRMGKSTKNLKFTDERFVRSDDEAEVVFLPKKPLVLTSFDECEPFGRMVAINSRYMVMSGKVLLVEYNLSIEDIKAISDYWSREIKLKLGWIDEFNKIISRYTLQETKDKSKK